MYLLVNVGHRRVSISAICLISNLVNCDCVRFDFYEWSYLFLLMFVFWFGRCLQSFHSKSNLDFNTRDLSLCHVKWFLVTWGKLYIHEPIKLPITDFQFVLTFWRFFLVLQCSNVFFLSRLGREQQPACCVDMSTSQNSCFDAEAVCNTRKLVSSRSRTTELEPGKVFCPWSQIGPRCPTTIIFFSSTDVSHLACLCALCSWVIDPQ